MMIGLINAKLQSQKNDESCGLLAPWHRIIGSWLCRSNSETHTALKHLDPSQLNGCCGASVNCPIIDEPIGMVETGCQKHEENTFFE